MTQTTHLALPFIEAAQAQKHVTHNEGLQLLDVLVQLSVSARNQGAPPVSPSEGQRFLVGAGATGAFAGKDLQIATFLAGAWTFLVPQAGWRVYVEAEQVLLVYDGAAWGDAGLALRALQNLSLLGLGTSASAGNPLSAKLNAALLTAKSVAEGGSGDLRVTLNKSASGNTVSQLYQTNFSGRAETGLTGNDNFSLKVSPDGSNFFASLVAHKDLHGRVSHKDSMRKTWAEWMPQSGAAGINALGIAASVIGTNTAVSPSAANMFTQSPRVKYVSAATAGSSSGLRGAGLSLWRGNAAGCGGFYVRMRGGIEVFQTDCRMFMGLYASTAVIGDVNPSTLLDMVGIGFDSGQTTLRLFSNDGAGAASAINLGAGFPTTGSQDLYELILSAEPNASEIRYRVERLNSGDVAEGVLTTNLPTNTAFMTPHMWLNNGATLAAVELAIVGMYAENASLSGSRGSIA